MATPVCACYQIDKLAGGRWAGEAAWAQKGRFLPHTHTKHCWACTRQVIFPSAPGKDGDTQLRFIVTLLPAPSLSWVGGGRAVWPGALEGSGGFPGPPCCLTGQPSAEPTGGWARTWGTPWHMGLACVGEAPLASRTVPVQGLGWLLSRKVSEVLSPLFSNCFFPVIHLVLLSGVGCYHFPPAFLLWPLAT